ncbi:hypothetical protein PUN28_012708 [Cardiocondyla obscurior]|uniref:Uncharacterized protein n=1 Tax=Cardiocondyla obscurior TaxID=286306 RepID=A0AAW2FG59_9HYME
MTEGPVWPTHFFFFRVCIRNQRWEWKAKSDNDRKMRMREKERGIEMLLVVVKEKRRGEKGEGKGGEGADGGGRVQGGKKRVEINEWEDGRGTGVQEGTYGGWGGSGDFRNELVRSFLKGSHRKKKIALTRWTRWPTDLITDAMRFHLSIFETFISFDDRYNF